MKKSELQQIIREEIQKVLSEAPNTITISYDGKKLTIDSESFKRLQAGEDVVGNNLEKGDQEEWILAKGNWRVVDSIKENSEKYMFFQNLETIKKEVEEMLSLDPQTVDAILANGHDWAADHIATSKDDIEEVHNFLMSNKAPMDEKKEFPDLTGDGKVTYADVLKGRGVKLKKN